MPNKTILITGATDGIGKQSALELLKNGHHIILHGRTPASAERAAIEIAGLVGDENIDTVSADFGDLAQVKEMAIAILKKHEKLDVLINNAGIYQNRFERSAQGYELTFAVNHLAHFVLTLHLLPLIIPAQNGRIVNVASAAHAAHLNFNRLNNPDAFDDYNSYAQSKLCNLLFSNYLAHEAAGLFVVNALHPGVINTKLLAKGFGMQGAGLQKGAETSVFLAQAREVENATGNYFVNKKLHHPAKAAIDENLQKELWDRSLEMSHDFLPNPGNHPLIKSLLLTD
ncbi:MAG: SDR family NAD(P)-dependent oxidoreductase [Clostridia bacterium]|nr:SDR family NAD(P)-dependent oxidoreductase [Clostridia bacterium]